MKDSVVQMKLYKIKYKVRYGVCSQAKSLSMSQWLVGATTCFAWVHRRLVPVAASGPTVLDRRTMAGLNSVQDYEMKEERRFTYV